VRDLRCGILSAELVKQGHEVLWWASTFDHARKRHRFDEMRTVSLSSGVQIKLLHGPGYETNRSPSRFWHQRVIARAFARESVRLARPDLIVCGLPLPELAEQAIAYGKKYQVPVVIDVRDQWPDIYLTMFPRRLRGLARLALITEFRRIKAIFRSASAILSVSDTYLDWALKHGGRPRRNDDAVFTLGYRPFEQRPDATEQSDLQERYRLRPDNMVVTFVGSFGFSYDLETVVQAAKVLQDRKIDNVQIVLVGDGDAGQRLRRISGDAPNLIFTGWLDQRSIHTMLGISTIGLAAYAEDATQTLPNKPFEYMAAGLPLLSSLGGELADLIRDEQIGLQYQPRDVESLVENIQWLAANPEARKTMAVRVAKLFDERFSSDVIYPGLVGYLEKIVQNRSSSQPAADD